MAIPIARSLGALDGHVDMETGGYGQVLGPLLQVPLSDVASVGAGAALTSIQARAHVAHWHRLRGVVISAGTATVVVAGTDPAVDVRRHLPVPVAPTAALISPAAAGNIEDGAHLYAVTFTNSAGETTPSETVSITVADKTVNGKVVLAIPFGPSGTTSRKIYRTEAAGTALKLLATVADNTTTTYTDNIADGSLGAAAPTANAAAATVLGATQKLSTTTSDRVFVEQPLTPALASGVETTVFPPCEYDARAVTGASTGALGNLQVYLLIELRPPQA